MRERGKLAVTHYLSDGRHHRLIAAVPKEQQPAQSGQPEPASPLDQPEQDQPEIKVDASGNRYIEYVDLSLGLSPEANPEEAYRYREEVLIYHQSERDDGVKYTRRVSHEGMLDYKEVSAHDLITEYDEIDGELVKIEIELPFSVGAFY